MEKVLILVGGNDRYHDVLTAGQVMQKYLISRGILAEYSQDFSILCREQINEYDVCIFYTQNKLLTKEEQQALRDRVAEGMGFIPLHAVNAIEGSDQELFLKLIGSEFIRHDPFKRFTVEFTEEQHFITENMEDFKIDDELYVTEYTDKVDTVLAQAEQDGKYYPMIYIKRLDKGKICYCALGHDGRAWYNPAFEELLYRMVIWSAKKDW
ncbi:MAG: ThuA domain-containing protein [Halothermotrichaceae bacterium]